MGEIFAQPEKKLEENQPKLKKKPVLQLWDEDQIEVKKLEEEDVDDILPVLRKCTFEVTRKEISGIISFNMSFACYVNRMVVGVGLAWTARYDPDRKSIVTGEPNAVYFEDPAVLLAYEGRGVRRILLRSREKESKSKSFEYGISYISEDLPKEGVESYIKEAGSQLEKLYLSEGYSFFKTKDGLLAVKRL